MRPLVDAPLTLDHLYAPLPTGPPKNLYAQVFHSCELSKANLTTPSKTLSEEVIQQVKKCNHDLTAKHYWIFL